MACGADDAGACAKAQTGSVHAASAAAEKQAGNRMEERVMAGRFQGKEGFVQTCYVPPVCGLE